MAIDPAYVSLVAALPPLIVASGLCSASETVLFGLNQSERMHLKAAHPRIAGIVESMLGEPAGLLATILLSNITINGAYFAAASVIALHETDPAWQVGISVGLLVAIVLGGEVIPKMAANAFRARLVLLLAPVLYALHVFLKPARWAITRLVAEPVARLTRADRVQQVTESDLDALVDLSARRGEIGTVEREFIQRLIRYRRVRVRDVMTPRVELAMVPRTAGRAAVVEACRRHRVKRLVVHGARTDDVLGLLDVRGYLLDVRGDQAPMEPHLQRPRFVPEVATLEQLGTFFRAESVDLAIVVDEYGGVAGVVAVEDAVEEIVGDIAAPGERSVEAPREVEPGVWSARGDVTVVAVSQAMGVDVPDVHASTIGGLAVELAGGVPEAGRRLPCDGVEIEVLAVDHGTVRSVLVRKRGAGRAA
jgi:CBS domain containing-hemolysin-like protein